MVKSVFQTGLRDWLVQRISAVVMAIYSIGIILYFLIHPQLGFSDWRALFANTWMKLATILFVLSLLFHAWVGIWTVLTDYVKPVALNWILQALIFLSLVVCFFWTLQILWSI